MSLSPDPGYLGGVPCILNRYKFGVSLPGVKTNEKTRRKLATVSLCRNFALFNLINNKPTLSFIALI
jgi:hypothetical protein